MELDNFKKYFSIDYQSQIITRTQIRIGSLKNEKHGLHCGKYSLLCVLRSY